MATTYTVRQRGGGGAFDMMPWQLLYRLERRQQSRSSSWPEKVIYRWRADAQLWWHSRFESPPLCSHLPPLPSSPLSSIVCRRNTHRRRFLGRYFRTED